MEDEKVKSIEELNDGNCWKKLADALEEGSCSIPITC
jgi:hypothetical protein